MLGYISLFLCMGAIAYCVVLTVTLYKIKDELSGKIQESIDNVQNSTDQLAQDVAALETAYLKMNIVRDGINAAYEKYMDSIENLSSDDIQNTQKALQTLFDDIAKAVEKTNKD